MENVAAVIEDDESMDNHRDMIPKFFQEDNKAAASVKKQSIRWWKEKFKACERERVCLNKKLNYIETQENQRLAEMESRIRRMKRSTIPQKRQQKYPFNKNNSMSNVSRCSNHNDQTQDLLATYRTKGNAALKKASDSISLIASWPPARENSRMKSSLSSCSVLSLPKIRTSSFHSHRSHPQFCETQMDTSINNCLPIREEEEPRGSTAMVTDLGFDSLKIPEGDSNINVGTKAKAVIKDRTLDYFKIAKLPPIYSLDDSKTKTEDSESHSNVSETSISKRKISRSRKLTQSSENIAELLTCRYLRVPMGKEGRAPSGVPYFYV